MIAVVVLRALRRERKVKAFFRASLALARRVLPMAETAKKDETRAKRMRKMIEMLLGPPN